MNDERDIKQLDQLFHDLAGGDVQLKLLLHGLLKMGAGTLDRLAELDERMKKIESQLSELSYRVEAVERKFSSAFVADDPAGHKQFHAEYIERTAELRKLRTAIAEKTLSALVWSGIVFIGLSSWNHVLGIIKRG